MPAWKRRDKKERERGAMQVVEQRAQRMGQTTQQELRSAPVTRLSDSEKKAAKTPPHPALWTHTSTPSQPPVVVGQRKEGSKDPTPPHPTLPSSPHALCFLLPTAHTDPAFSPVVVGQREEGGEEVTDLRQVEAEQHVHAKVVEGALADALHRPGRTPHSGSHGLGL